MHQKGLFSKNCNLRIGLNFLPNAKKNDLLSEIS